MVLKIVLCFGLAMACLSAQGRLVRSWSEAELMQVSDLVVVAQPVRTRDLDETNSLGWSQSPSFQPRFRGVETTFKVSDVFKGRPESDRIVLHHYRMEPDWGSPPNGPSFVTFTPGSANTSVLYLIKDGTNRYAPATGQIDPSNSLRTLPTNYFLMGFPAPPPLADVDPLKRHAVQVHIPVRMHAERHEDSILVKTDELVLTNLTVGSNMVTGTKCEAKIYQGDRLVSDVGSSLQGGLADGGYNQTFQRALYGVPKAGENYAIVIELMMFETDEPAQHFWSPASGTKYKMLYEQSFRLTVSK